MITLRNPPPVRRQTPDTTVNQEDSIFGQTFAPQLVATLRKNSFADPKADVSAGLSVAVVSLPLARALAVASDGSPASGLASAIAGD